MVFGHFLDHYLKYFDETWSEVRQNGEECFAKVSRLSFAIIKEVLRVKDGQNRPTFMNDPNCGRKLFLQF